MFIHMLTDQTREREKQISQLSEVLIWSTYTIVWFHCSDWKVCCKMLHIECTDEKQRQCTTNKGEEKTGSLNSETYNRIIARNPEREDARNCVLAQFLRFARWSVCQLSLQIWWSHESLYSWRWHALWLMCMQPSRSDFLHIPSVNEVKMNWRSDHPIHGRWVILVAVNSLCVTAEASWNKVETLD